MALRLADSVQTRPRCAQFSSVLNSIMVQVSPLGCELSGLVQFNPPSPEGGTCTVSSGHYQNALWA
eukprot:1728285-Amphidinium_carterae.1